MEVDSDEPFAIREIRTEIDLVVKIETGTNPIIEIEANTTKVEEIVSLANSALWCNFVAHDFAPPTFQ